MLTLLPPYLDDLTAAAVETFVRAHSAYVARGGETPTRLLSGEEVIAHQQVDMHLSFKYALRITGDSGVRWQWPRTFSAGLLAELQTNVEE